jgi:hypothetical protein
VVSLRKNHVVGLVENDGRDFHGYGRRFPRQLAMIIVKLMIIAHSDGPPDPETVWRRPSVHFA